MTIPHVHSGHYLSGGRGLLLCEMADSLLKSRKQLVEGRLWLCLMDASFIKKG